MRLSTLEVNLMAGRELTFTKKVGNTEHKITVKNMKVREFIFATVSVKCESLGIVGIEKDDNFVICDFRFTCRPVIFI